jgi:DNA-binding transcriptional ArsR family regulator
VSAFAALSEPHRRQILDLLRDNERTVTELVAKLHLSQPGVSKHLRILREGQLVDVRPVGRERWYRLRAEPLAEIDDWLQPYRAYWLDRLEALERHLQQRSQP